MVRPKGKNLWDVIDGRLIEACQREDFKAAEAIFGRALEEAAKTGYMDADFDQTVHQLAALYCARRRYAEAELIYARLLKAKEQMLGADHPDLIDTLARLAEIHRADGRKAEAADLSFRALSLSESRFVHRAGAGS